MADQEPMGVPDHGQLLHADLTNHLRHRLSYELNEMAECVDDLRGLATLLDWHTSLHTNASPEDIREAAVGLRAIAMQGFISACRVASLAARLNSWAEISGFIKEPEEPEAEGPDPEESER